MSMVALVILGILGLFLLLLLLKQSIKYNSFCAICLAVSLTGISLLALLWLNIFNNTVLLALLLGHSSLGIYYLLEKHATEELLVFRLPLLLTLIVLVYSLVTVQVYLDAVMVLAGVWFTITLLYVFRTSPVVRKKVQALIECCSSW